MNLVSTDPNTEVAGLRAHTPNNGAAFAAGTTLSDGTPMISANYPTSTVKYFDLVSWYFGCVLAAGESLDSAPVSCMITATGYDSTGMQVALQTFNFVAHGSLQNMNPDTFNSAFRRVYSVTFTVSNPTMNAAAIDNVVTIVYQ